MNRNVLSRWLLLAAIIGIILLFYTLGRVSPFVTPARPNYPAIILLFGVLFFSASSIMALVALGLHGRWPSLAGARGNVADPIAAVRQGILFGLALLIILLLAYLDILDIIFALVTLLLAGLLEGFIQNQR